MPVLLVAMGCLPVFSQSSLATVEQDAAKAYADWFALAGNLDLRLARMLPCDSGVTTAIEETAQAATRRMVTLTVYTRALAEQATQDVAMARRIQQSETAYLTGVGTERNDTDQERAEIDRQMAQLSASVRKKVSLTAALEALRAVETLVQDRANLVTSNASTLEGILKQFDDLVKALEARAAAIQQQLPVLEDERTKWNGYYTARLARARIECSVTGTVR